MQNQEGVEIEYGRNGRTSSPADSKIILKCENKWSDSIVYAAQFQNLIEKFVYSLFTNTEDKNQNEQNAQNAYFLIKVFGTIWQFTHEFLLIGKHKYRGFKTIWI